MFQVCSFICFVAFFLISIYCIVLFIKLAHRGIEAFEIYIDKNENNEEE